MVLKEMSDNTSLKKELDDLKLKLFTIVRRVQSLNEIERIEVYKELIQQETFLKDLNNEISELLDLSLIHI